MALSQQVVDYTHSSQPSCAHLDTLLQAGDTVICSQWLCACFTHTQCGLDIARTLFLTNGLCVTMVDCRLSGELPRYPKKRPSSLSLSPLPPQQDSLEDTGDATSPVADSGMIRAHKQPAEPADDPASPELQDAAKSASLLPPQGMAWGPSVCLDSICRLFCVRHHCFAWVCA